VTTAWNGSAGLPGWDASTWGTRPRERAYQEVTDFMPNGG
jgi:hypothetical protein